MIIFVLFLVGLVFFVITKPLEKLSKSDIPEDTSVVLGVVAWIIGAIMIFIAMITYPHSLSSVSEMGNFYERNQKIFYEAVIKFPNASTIETKNDTTNTVRISWDYTKEVLEYNTKLQWYKNYQFNWFFGIFVTSVPAKLEFITLQR